MIKTADIGILNSLGGLEGTQMHHNHIILVRGGAGCQTIGSRRGEQSKQRDPRKRRCDGAELDVTFQSLRAHAQTSVGRVITYTCENRRGK